MSLLMKALKQAEQSKRNAEKEDILPTPDGSALTPEAFPNLEPDFEPADLEPDIETEPVPISDAKPLEAAEFEPLFLELQSAESPSLEAEPNKKFFDSSGAGSIASGSDIPIEPRQPVFTPPTGTTLPEKNAPQHDKRGQAKNVFAAKQPVRSKRKPLFWAVAAAVVVLVSAIQGYRFWKEYTRPAIFTSSIPVPSLIPLAGPVEKPQLQASLPTNTAADNAPVSVEITSTAAKEGDTFSATRALPSDTKEQAVPVSSRIAFTGAIKTITGDAAAAPPAESKTRDLPTAGVRKNTPYINPEGNPAYPRASRPAKTAAFRQTTKSSDDETVDPQFFSLSGKDPIRITPTRQSERSVSQIDIAYQSFMRNDFVTARQEYQKVLQNDSTNRDALLGLASIAVKNQKLEEAAAYYQRLLALDPKDAIAQAGMVGLTGGVNPIESESRIKMFLSQQPNADYLHFAIGNIYLTQSRWPEAQQAFFRAHQLSPATPDYAFNLAVSLDHLNQARLAADFYRRALDLSFARPANFDRESLEDRLRTLTATVTP
jgi:Tfp pilus assembly protein PilF